MVKQILKHVGVGAVIMVLAMIGVMLFSLWLGYFGGIHEQAYGGVPTTSGMQKERDPFRGIRAIPARITGEASIVGAGNSVDVLFSGVTFNDSTEWIVLLSSKKMQNSGTFFAPAYVTKTSATGFTITKTATTVAADTIGWDWLIIEGS